MEGSSNAVISKRFAKRQQMQWTKRGAQPTHPVAPAADLNTWLAEARACGISAVETFAAGLEQDGGAVRAALTEPWSSGQAEGQINRLKFLKRQSYGRASIDLLRPRVLIAA